MPDVKLTPYHDIPCCPDLDTSPVCDIVDFRRRLVFPTSIRGEDRQPVRVEVIFHTRFTRCSGPMALGDVVYTTTLLPGEKVRLATTDRRSRFSFDSSTNLSYRSEQMSEEQYRLRAFRAFMSDENSVDRVTDSKTEQGRWDFHGDASGGLGFFSVHADTNARGSHNASSARDYMHEHKAHAEMSDTQSVEATRKAHSLSIGSVESRTHIEGESEDHFESSSREFSNPNRCHALTFLFYRLNKTETVKFELVKIVRRVIDQAAPPPVASNPYKPAGGIATIPQEIPAGNANRLSKTGTAIISDRVMQNSDRIADGILLDLGSQQDNNNRAIPFSNLNAGRIVSTFPQPTVDLSNTPITEALRQKALAEVDKQLADSKLIDPKTGLATAEAIAEFSYERKTSLPTAGVVVKGCYDDCDICEPNLERQIQLELDNLELKNKLLAKQIDLLEKSQEYRCCPSDCCHDEESEA